MKRFKNSTLIHGCMDWRDIADADWRLAFLLGITSTRQHPDLIIWSVNSKKFIIAELTIPFKVNINWVHQRKLEIYKDLEIGC